MRQFSPRISPRLVALVERLAGQSLSTAEIRRRVGVEAERLGLAQPSYETVRRLVAEHRAAPRYPTLTEVALDVAFQVRPPEAVLDQLAGTLPPK